MSDIEKCLFRKEIARFRDRSVIRPIKKPGRRIYFLRFSQREKG